MNKINRLALELQRGAWAISIEALNIYGVLAHNFVSGKQIENEVKPESCISFYDSSFNLLKKDRDGIMTIPEGSIAVIELIGAITKYGGACSYGAEDIVLALEYADNHPNIIGTVLKVDGPGGAVSAISPFETFAKTKNKPIVAIYDQACSAHLWIMLALSDFIIADNDIVSEIGSVGVVLHWVDNRKFLESLGYVFHEVYPKESEHKNEAVKLAMEGKYEMIIEEMLSPMARRFQEFVKSSRPNLKTETPGLLTGKTFSSPDALKIGLIDAIGTMADAKNMITILSELK